jgi:hypothetical protein
LKFIYGWLGLPHLPWRAVPGNPSLKIKKKASELAGFGNPAKQNGFSKHSLTELQNLRKTQTYSANLRKSVQNSRRLA